MKDRGVEEERWGRMRGEALWDLRGFGSAEKAKKTARFFKTKTGDYSGDDEFLGVNVPEVRAVAKKWVSLGNKGAEAFLLSPLHEVRMLGLLIWVERFAKADTAERGEIFSLYRKNARNVSNWDLVDLTAATIVGGWLWETKDTAVLDEFAASENLWERRIAVVSTHAWIRKGEVGLTLRLAEKLLDDREDLIRKAVGWMLREAGKKDLEAEKQFLDKHAATMPRVTLRYAIEKFSFEERKRYLGMAKK